jgi:Kef-type K+ transport system membrane component KefB
MWDLVFFTVLIAIVGLLVTSIVSILVASILRHLFSNLSIGRLSALSGAFGPLLAGVFLIALLIDVGGGDERVSGPEAQGLMVICLAFVMVIGPGWWFGNWAVRRIFLDGRRR